MLPPGGAVLTLIIVLAAASIGDALGSPGLFNRDAQGVNFWKLRRRSSSSASASEHATQSWTGISQIPLAAVAPATAVAVPEFSAETFTQPLDHFYNSTDATFPQRFWVNSRHYKPRPGAPVIVIDGGETNGEDRLPFLDTGIADILARATGGIGVVLEHRYYGAFLSAYLHSAYIDTNGIVSGKSINVQNLSTDALRCAPFCSKATWEPCARIILLCC